MAKNTKEPSADITYPEQKIVEMHIDKEVRKSFLEYSMSVIVARALPDARDGLKPVHRRILYAMYEDKLTSDNPFRKSATTVGNVLGRYHPHGDSSVYDAMVRLAQDFSMRYPLIEGHGNFGNVDGDGAAAYRYTEARMAKLSNEMLADIDKNVVDFSPNFDNTRPEPDVLPSRFPNLLVNGSVGIAVGMATYIPPHNLREVIDATVYLMEHPDAEIDELCKFVKGPDFPTRGVIHGTNGIKAAYHTGRGRIMVRGRATVMEERHRIEIYEIPYGVNKSMLVKSIVDLVKTKRIDGITALRDESGRHGMKIVIEFRRDCNGNVILNQLYKFTQLQDTCAVNMLALVGGEPKTLNLKQALEVYVGHQKNVVRRRTEFELDRAQKRAHILEGLKIAILNIDEVIRIIRASRSIPDAKTDLMTAFALDDVQAQAIVEMQLGRLSNLETIKVEQELDKLCALIEELTGILTDEVKLKELIKKEITEIGDKYGDDRRTSIEEDEDEIPDEDLLERYTAVITMTHDGYFKRQKASDYEVQGRGGMGRMSTATKEEDFVERVIIADTHSTLMLFTDTGKVFTLRTFRIPESGRSAKGANIVNFVELEDGEKITAIIPVDGFPEDEYLFMVTKNGTVKKTALSEFEYQRKSGKRALSLDEGDKLLFVHRTKGEDRIIIAAKTGDAICFDESEVRSMGRTATGVRGIRLEEGDEVCGAAIAEEGKTLLTVSEKGFAKRTEFSEFTPHHRGGGGMRCYKAVEKTGMLCGIAAVCEDEDIMLITASGGLIRVHAGEISTQGRSASGVRTMNTEKHGNVVSFTTVRE